MFREEEARKTESIMVTLDKDSLVAGKKYVKALCQDEARKTFSTLLYRQEGDCVYYLNEANEEVKILDYSLQPGDTFTSENGTDWEVMEVGFFKEIFYGSYDGSSAPRMYKLKNREGSEDIWVEGAGSLERGILPIGFDGQKDILVSRLTYLFSRYLFLENFCGEKGIPTIVHRDFYSQYGYVYDRMPKTWYTHYVAELGENTKENVTLWVQNRNDTLIGENTYMTMLEGKSEMGNQNLLFQPNPTDTLYYRQEDSRVFMRSVSDNRDILLFDYSLLKGETFTSDDGTEWRVTATSWDSNNKMKDYHKIFLCDKDGNEDVWIEGAGSEQWGIMPASAVHASGLVPEPYRSRVRTLFSEEVSFSYSINEEDYKYILDGYCGKLPQDRTDEPLGLDVSFLGDTLRIKGNIRWIFGSPCAECEVRGDSIHVILFQAPSFSYQFHSLAPSWIDVRIPRFRPGTWHVYGYAAHDGVNHTFDSIEIDTTLTCGDDMGVSPLPASPRRGDDALYDLQGRRLNAVPQRGLYIQGGKMRMAW